MARASRGKLSATRARAWRACAGALAALALVPPAQAAGETGRKWQPHVDAVAKLSTQRNVGKLDVFLPLLQGKNGLLFADLRGVLADDPSQEGNFGLGYRHIFRDNDRLYGADFALGFYAFYDRRRSLTDKIFNQGTVGAEFLTEDWDLHVNFYIPQNQAKIVGFSSTGSTGVALVGTGLFTAGSATTTTVREQALPGFDVEAGRRLSLRRDHELWLHAGYFRFARQGTIVVQGPRLRLEYRYDNPFGWRGARITLGAEARHDVVRHTDAFGVVRLRIPLDGLFFGGSHKTKAPRLVGIDRRMDEYVVRDTDIVSNTSSTTVTTGGGASVPVTDAGSGENIHVFFVDNTGGGDCTQATPCTTAAATGSGDFGAGDVIVPLSATGIIAGNIALAAARQQIVGGGAAGTAALVFTDAAASTLALAGLGGRATLNGQVTLFQDANVRGFDINNTNAGGIGIFAGSDLGLASANVSDMSIQGSTNNNSVVTLNASGTVNFASDVATTATSIQAAFRIEGTGATGTVNVNYAGTITQNGTGESIKVQSNAGGTLSFTGPIIDTIANNGGQILFTGNNAGVTLNLSGGFALNTGASRGLQLIGGGGTVNITGTNSIVTTSGPGVDISNGAVVSLNNTAITTGGGIGVLFSGPTPVNVSGTGNTVTGPGVRCFVAAVAVIGSMLINGTAAPPCP